MIALIPKLVVPLLIIFIPAETKILLLKSRGTKSATVPNATKSSKSTNTCSSREEAEEEEEEEEEEKEEEDDEHGGDGFAEGCGQ